MKICIYGEPLIVYTSGNPFRGLVKELITLRKDDEFIIVLRSKPLAFLDYFNELSNFSNASLVYLKSSRKISNLFALLGLRFYNLLKIDADLCISPGNPDYFYGFKGKTINFLADLSSIRNSKNSSLKWHGKLIQKNILKLGIKHTNKMLCISNFTKTDLIDLYPKYSEKAEVLHCGISDFWFDEDYIELESAVKYKKEYGDYFIWWGAISPRKNLNNLLYAYKKAVQIESLPRIIIVGELVAEDSRFTSLLSELKDYITLLPFQELKTLKGYIQESKGVLFPSFYEGFGLPVIEAYAMGKPVLHSNVTSLPEIANKFGVEVDPHSVESISNGLIILNKYNDLLGTDRISYASEFRYDVAAKRISEIINRV